MSIYADWVPVLVRARDDARALAESFQRQVDIAKQSEQAFQSLIEAWGEED